MVSLLRCDAAENGANPVTHRRSSTHAGACLESLGEFAVGDIGAVGPCYQFELGEAASIQICLAALSGMKVPSASRVRIVAHRRLATCSRPGARRAPAVPWNPSACGSPPARG